MRLISWDWFWYVLLGFVMGGGAAYLHAYLKVKMSKLNWYELLLTVLIFIAVLFMGQTFIASFYEGENRAAWLTLVFMGLPIIVMAVAVIRSYRKRIAS